MARSHSASTSTAKQKNKKEKPVANKKVPNTEVDPKRKTSASGNNDLRSEILALGGDEEDYDILKDVDSDVDASESGVEKKDAALSKDVAKFLKGLDLSTVAKSNVEATSESDEREAENDDSSDTSTTSKDQEQETTVNEKDKINKASQVVLPKVGSTSKLLVEPSPQWYLSVPRLASSEVKGPSSSSHTSLQSKAASLHASELSEYESASSGNKLTNSSSDATFLQRILSSGTLSDRLSALTLMAQSSPLHNTKALETLRGMAQKKGREESLKALRAIVDWWVGGGAPDWKLKYFIDQPFSSSSRTDKHLLVWHFEDWLKKYFYSILQILEPLSLDPLPYVRLQAMSLILTLLRDKPEQEQNLLRLLVNKLGDSERPVASRASYYLLQLLQKHPQMKSVVVRELSSLILRPLHSSAAPISITASGATHLKFTDNSKPKPENKGRKDQAEKRDLQQEHARYYATITLNQILLTPTESDRAVAVQLINLYFELFKQVLGQVGKPQENVKDDNAHNEVDHTRAGKEKRKKKERNNGKGKEEQEASAFAEVEDSNSKYISAILTGVNRALPFAKLGLENVEFTKHIDTLFLISHKSTFNISLQALRLIMHICQSFVSTQSQSSSHVDLGSSITDRYYRVLYASLLDTRLNTSSKQAMFLNLLLKSMKQDKKPERVQAFVRRFIQLLVGAGNGGIEFVAGGLFLLGELFKTGPGFRDMLNSTHALKRKATGDNALNEYDPRKREPQYANANASPVWELTPLLRHYHPTIRLHASQLLSGKELTANADLSLNTLSHFLDRFVYKNPKKPKPKGSSAMQPAATAADGTSVKVIKGVAGGDIAVNDPAFWNKNEGDVPVDQVFFHKYFSKKSQREKAKADKVAKRKGVTGDSVKGDSDHEHERDDDNDEDDSTRSAKDKEASGSSDDEDSEEASIWQAMQATLPDLRGDGDDDDDESLGSGFKDSDSEQDSDVEDSVHEDSEDNISLAEDSDAEDLIDLDADIPEGLIEYQSGDSDEDSDNKEGDKEWGGFDDTHTNTHSKKRRRSLGHSEQKNKKKKLRSLPTFASYDDYAKMIEDGPEDYI